MASELQLDLFTVSRLEAKIDELQKRITELERRVAALATPMWVVPPYNPNIPTPVWCKDTIVC